MSNDNSFFGADMYDEVTEEVSGFQVGTINDNVVLDSTEYVSGEKNGRLWEGIRFTYKRKMGAQVQIVTDQVLPVNPEIIKGWNHQESFEATLKNLRNNWFARMKHIVSRFGVDMETLKNATASATSFQDYANKLINLLDTVNDKRKLYLKIVPNKDGYASVPMYPKFLQEMSTGDCILAFSKGEKKIISKYSSDTPDANAAVEILDDGDIML